jgi:hypothetical protein
MKRVNAFDAVAMLAFEPEAKVGLLATANPDGLPHITLITAMQAKTPTQIIWGQFTEGLSKAHVRKNPKTAFLILTMDRKLWRGKALWTHSRKEGEDYEMFNTKPMFRYNAYLGIHTVHYMNLVETYGMESLPLPKIVLASLLTKLGKPLAKTQIKDRILKPWGEGLFNRLDALKFIAYIGSNGFPVIIPILQCQASDSRRLAFSPLAYARELETISEGAPVAVFGLSMQMEDCLVRGVYRKRGSTLPLSIIDIDWVYNSMPPKSGQIYPELELKPVVNF